ncbi:MAG: hypothetical protein ACOC0E_01865 [Spirochaetota bacterium]
MREANPRAHLNRLIADRNYLGAQLYLKEAELEKDERDELLGALATALVDELSRTRRDDRERLVYLRSVLAWVLREVPGLGSLYREQLRSATGGGDMLSDLTRGLRNLGDVASGRKSVGEGFNDAADDARRNFEDATERMRSGESGARVNEFFTAAEKGIRQGLDQLGEFFRVLNDEQAAGPSGGAGQAPGDTDRPTRGAEEAAARADREEDVEDAEFAPEEGESDTDDGRPINVERE